MWRRRSHFRVSFALAFYHLHFHDKDDIRRWWHITRILFAFLSRMTSAGIPNPSTLRGGGYQKPPPSRHTEPAHQTPIRHTRRTESCYCPGLQTARALVIHVCSCLNCRLLTFFIYFFYLFAISIAYPERFQGTPNTADRDQFLFLFFGE